MSRFRNFCFTSYRILSEDERLSLFNDNDIKYIIYQHEQCPSTGREHLQGYCELSKQLRLTTLRDKFLRGSNDSFHVETRRGTQEQAIAYASKLDTRLHGPYTFGTPNTPGNRTDLQVVCDHFRSGGTLSDALAIEDFPLPTYIKNYKFFENVTLLMNNEPRNHKSKVIYVYGPTGTGKSRMAYEAGAKDISITSSGFIMGYNHDEVVCFDDIEPGTFTRQQWLKLFDRHPCTVNVKGLSNVQWNPKTIYLTSNYNPITVCAGDQAMLRRIDEVIFLDGSEVGGSKLPPTSESGTPESGTSESDSSFEFSFLETP